jgi:mono/diheme cytochrome c family protein
MKKAILFGLFLLLASCATTLYVPLQSVGSISIENLKKGRELYVNNCASCHQLYMPNRYNEKQWIHNLDEMQVRAKISDTDKKLILDYLVNAPK